MEGRLDGLDSEMDGVEAAIRALERELAVPPVPAPRFPACFARDGDDLSPERADGLTRRCKPRYSMGGRHGQPVVGGWPLPRRPESGLEDSAEAHVAASRSRSPERQGSASSSSALPVAARWGPPTGTRRVRVRLRLASRGEGLGLVIDKRSPPGSVVVAAVRPQSAVACWNDAHVAGPSQDLQVQPGDTIVEANGSRISTREDLRNAIADALDVCLVLRRDASSPPCGHSAGLQTTARGSADPAGSSRQGASPRRHQQRPHAARRSDVAPAARIIQERSRASARGSDAADREERAASPLSTEALLPGRWCRAVVAPDARPPPPDAPSSQPPRAAAIGGKFGSAPRFEPARAEQEEGPPLDCPSDRFLSTRSTPKCAFIQPETPHKQEGWGKMKKWFDALASEVGVPAICSANAPGLRGVTSSWVAAVRDVLLAADAEDGSSTDTGSDRGDDTASFWSSSVSDSVLEPQEPPGPGTYRPQFAAVAPSTSRGTPSFGRYAGREPPARQPVLPEDESSEASEQQQPLVAPSSEAPRPPSPPLTARGGKIAPLPSHKPRIPTTREQEAEMAAQRPFYDAMHTLVEESVPAASFGFVADGGTLGDHQRSGGPESAPGPGPGSYELPALLPSGPAAVIAPEGKAVPSGGRQRPTEPGPADYDAGRADSLVYPGLAASSFQQTIGHSMGFQAVPYYVVRYAALDPRWEAVRRRSLSATILPVHAVEGQRRRRAGGARVGPGSYFTDSSLVQRIRPDVRVLRWFQRSDGVPEHVGGLYKERPVDRAIRGDPRPLLGASDDEALRRRHPVALFPPLPDPSLLRRSWAAGDGWRFYDPLPTPAPEGYVSFSRRVDFEDFPAYEHQWTRNEERYMRRLHASFRLAYSLPELEATHARAPAHDFGLAAERPSSEPGDGSPREGDVLLLSLGAEQHLLHPRPLAPVDMSRQLGRPEALPEEVDDFEELVLSPRPPRKRTPVYVDMARSQGRPQEPQLSANLWADAGGRLYAYQPSAGLRLRDEFAEELLLSPSRGERYLQRTPRGGDFSRALGRPGVDPRLSVDGEASQEEALLTNWTPRFRPPPLPAGGGALVGADLLGDL